MVKKRLQGHLETTRWRVAQRHQEEAALARLAELRAGLLAQQEAGRDPRRPQPAREEKCCRRPQNQMRISPLEARAIEIAVRTNVHLSGKLPQILERLAAELPNLTRNTERQSFTCPLLEGSRCLVHSTAKPVGCLAWHSGKDYTKLAWESFADRDELNDAVYGPDWKLRVIPLWLQRVYRRDLARRSGTAGSKAPAAKTDSRKTDSRNEGHRSEGRRKAGAKRSTSSTRRRSTPRRRR